MADYKDWEGYLDYTKFEKVGDFLYYQGPGLDIAKGLPFMKLSMELSKLEKPQPFIHDYGVSVNITTVNSSRMWLMFEGNLACAICIPRDYLKTQNQYHLFPIFASFAVRDTFNYFSPGQYFSKYPNDIVCKDHMRKNCGILIRRNGKYITVQYGANLVACPDDSEIRAEGLKACHLGKHTDKVVTRREFVLYSAQKILEYIQKYDTPEKVMQLSNEGFNEMGPKLWKLEMNNPNANCDVDGTLWTSDHPNALFKGYLNGREYERCAWLFDDAVPDVDKKHPSYVGNFEKKP